MPEGDEPVAMQRQVPILQAAQNIAGAHLAQYIDGVVDVPVDKEPDEAAHLLLRTPDHVAQSVTVTCKRSLTSLPDSVAAIGVQGTDN